ncbi:Rz1 family lipoprotein [Escherichia coli]|uniref:Rz1 family lipoprotein n=1 Tax=Escherichia coli TaxID=562 RepID=UPI00224C1151|nr:Rz1 family lipoprotein [Escherichia coli]
MKPPPPRAWIMQPPPDWQTSLNRIISPSERGLSLCKNNCREPRSILMNSADRAPHIDGQLMQLL